MLKRFLFFIISLSAANHLYSQTPAYSNEFLSIGVGARALAMGNANAASASDITAGFWNPAGLVNIPSNLQIGLMHSEYFAGIIKYDYGSIASKLHSGNTVGFSFIRSAIDNIPNTTEMLDANGQFNYDKIKSFSAADYAFFLSFSKKTKITGLNFGANAKVVHRITGDFASAWGFGLDAAVQYQKNNWRFGIMGKDITTTFNAWSFNLPDKMKETFYKTGNEIPVSSVEITLPKLICGVAYQYNIQDKFSILLELDLDFTFDGKRNVLIKSKAISIDPHVGIELGYNNFIFLRGGITNIQDIKDFDGIDQKVVQPNMGVGIKLKKLTIDYALSTVGNQGGDGNSAYTHIFSLKLDIYKQQKKQ